MRLNIPQLELFNRIVARRVYVDRLAMERLNWAGSLAIGAAMLASRRLGIEPVSNLAQKEC